MTAPVALAVCLLLWAAPASAQDAGVPPSVDGAPPGSELMPSDDAGAADASVTPDADIGDASPVVEALPDGVPDEPLPAWAAGVGAPVEPAVPPLASLPPPPRRGELDLWVQGEGRAEGWHLLVRASESDRWSDVCVLPCRVSPDAGRWYIAVSVPGRREPVRASAIELSHHGVLSLRYYDRTTRHVVGGLMILVGVLGLVAGSAILITSLDESYFGVLGVLPLIAGAVVSGVGIGLAVAPTFLRVTWSAP